MVAPLAVMMVMPVPCFLKPKVLVGVRHVLEGGFLVSSPLLRPASDGERWMPLDLGESRPFSDTLASSVLPAHPQSSDNAS